LLTKTARPNEDGRASYRMVLRSGPFDGCMSARHVEELPTCHVAGVMIVLVTYDIADADRRADVTLLLSGCGLESSAAARTMRRQGLCGAEAASHPITRQGRKRGLTRLPAYSGPPDVSVGSFS